MHIPKNLQMSLEENNYMLLNITPAHIEKLYKLPYIHRDPFDRMFIAQSLVENLLLVTTDT